MSSSESAALAAVVSTITQPDRRGRWIWAAGILAVASAAQGILWGMWWDDATYSTMSVLFVWPAALFALAIWWLFFSGWSWKIRFGGVALILAGVTAFFRTYRLEWDGAMVPRRLVLRSKPTADEVARAYRLRQSAAVLPQAKTSTEDDPATVALVPLVATQGDWPGFRGPQRNGLVSGGSLRRNWDQSPPRELWRHPVGRGWSGFAVIGKYAFTQEQRDSNECVVAYELDTGAELWVHADETVLSIVDANGGPGPHATPQFDEGLVYTLGGTGLLNCLDAATGKAVWGTNILQDAGNGNIPASNLEWGMSGSPLIVDQLVIVIPGGTSKEGAPAYDQGVAAYDKKSGQRVWAVGKHQSSYGSPRVEDLGGVRQLLIPQANGLSGHSLETGAELWFYPLENPPKVNATMPWRLDDHSLLFGTGYGIGTSCIDLEQVDGAWVAKQRWHTNRFRPKFNDFFIREGYAYGLDDGTLACVDVGNGKIQWKSGRYGYGQLLLVDDVVLIISEDGELLLVPAQPAKPEPIATFKAMDSGFCWNQLTLVHGKLLVRNGVEAACFDVSRESP